MAWLARLPLFLAAAEAGFAPWTEVLLGNGSRAEIVALRPGDVVASWDDELGRPAKAEVLMLEVWTTEEVLEMGTLVFTADQPFHGGEGAVSARPEATLESYGMEVGRMGEELYGCDGLVRAEVRERKVAMKVVTLELGGPHWFCAGGLRAHNKGFHGSYHSSYSGGLRGGSGGGGSGGVDDGNPTALPFIILFFGVACCCVMCKQCCSTNSEEAVSGKEAVAKKRKEREAMARSNSRGLGAVSFVGECRTCGEKSATKLFIEADASGGISGSSTDADGTVKVVGRMNWPQHADWGEIAWREVWPDGAIEAWGTISPTGISATFTSEWGELGNLWLQAQEGEKEEEKEEYIARQQRRREAMAPQNGAGLCALQFVGVHREEEESSAASYALSADAHGVIKGTSTTEHGAAAILGLIVWPENAGGGQIAWRESWNGVDVEAWGTIFRVGASLKVSAEYCCSTGVVGHLSLHEAGAVESDLAPNNGRGLTSTRWVGEYSSKGESSEAKYEWIADAAGRIKGIAQGYGSTATLTGSLNWPATAESGEIAWREQWRTGDVAEVRGTISAQLKISAAQFPSWSEECKLTLSADCRGWVPPVSREGTAVQEKLPLLRA